MAGLTEGRETHLIRQRTLGNQAHTSGVGLHSGAHVKLALRPASPATGIVFRRLDLGRRATVRATVENVVDTHYATTLAHGDVRISTVEHLMAALAGVGIDNAEIDVTGPEIPIMDGSSAPFVRLIERAGVVEQHTPKRFLRVLRRIAYSDGGAIAELKPHTGFRVEYTMSYEHRYLRSQCQHAAVDVCARAFGRQISRARTFGTLADIEALTARGLAQGGSLDNAIVVDDDGILNEGGLRYHDEFVKHKMLDAIGDLRLCGYPIIGLFVGCQSGHGTNHGLLQRLLATPDAFEIVTGMPSAKAHSRAVDAPPASGRARPRLQLESEIEALPFSQQPN